MSDTTKSSISLEWTKPTYDGGASLSGYVVEMATGDSEAFENVSGVKPIEATQFTVTNLMSDVKYRYNDFYNIYLLVGQFIWVD